MHNDDTSMQVLELRKEIERLEGASVAPRHLRTSSYMQQRGCGVVRHHKKGLPDIARHAGSAVPGFLAPQKGSLRARTKPHTYKRVGHPRSPRLGCARAAVALHTNSDTTAVNSDTPMLILDIVGPFPPRQRGYTSDQREEGPGDGPRMLPSRPFQAQRYPSNLPVSGVSRVFHLIGIERSGGRPSSFRTTSLGRRIGPINRSWSSLISSV